MGVVRDVWDATSGKLIGPTLDTVGEQLDSTVRKGFGIPTAGIQAGRTQKA